MRNILTVVAVLCLCCFWASAQSTSAERVNQWKLYGGYQYTGLDSHSVQDVLNLAHATVPGFPLLKFGSRPTMNGWNFGIENDVAKWFGVVIDAGAGYDDKRLLLRSDSGINTSTRTRMSFYTFTGGPQFTFYRGSRVQPFMRAQIGGGFFRSHTDVVVNNVAIVHPVSADDEGFAGGGGAGTDVFFSRRFGMRIAADWLHTNLFDESQNHIRGNVALVFRF